jgi:type IV pilus assembly protein PilE
MRGITLIELMIVVVIISILAAVSYPSYREFVARAKRTEAKAALLQIATNQERQYLQNNTFTQDLTTLGFTFDPFTTASGSYVIAVSAADAANFTATATFQLGGTEATKCNVFTLTGAGVRSSTPDADCWTRTR